LPTLQHNYENLAFDRQRERASDRQLECGFVAFDDGYFGNLFALGEPAAELPERASDGGRIMML
jgi:hypothetical protein